MDIERLLDECRTHGDASEGPAGGEQGLEDLAAGCQQLSLRLGSALSLHYFSHVDDVPPATVGL